MASEQQAAPTQVMAAPAMAGNDLARTQVLARPLAVARPPAASRPKARAPVNQRAQTARAAPRPRPQARAMMFQNANAAASVKRNFDPQAAQDAQAFQAAQVVNAEASASQQPRPPSAPQTARDTTPGVRNTANGYGYRAVIRPPPFAYQKDQTVGLYHARAQWIGPRTSSHKFPPTGHPGYPRKAEYYFSDQTEHFSDSAGRHAKDMKDGTWLYKRPVEQQQAFAEFDLDNGQANFAVPAIGYGQRHRNWYKMMHRNQFDQFPIRYNQYPC